MQQILAIGTDPSLLRTRSMILQRTGAHVRTADPGVALLLLGSEPFGTLVICHSLEDRVTGEIIRAARRLHPETKVLLVENSWKKRDRSSMPQRLFLVGEAPGAILSAARRLLGDITEEAPSTDGRTVMLKATS